jgi:hypothetical protein
MKKIKIHRNIFIAGSYHFLLGIAGERLYDRAHAYLMAAWGRGPATVANAVRYREIALYQGWF